MSYLSAAITLFFVLDPLGNLMPVMSVLGRMDPKRRRWIVLREGMLATTILLLFYLAGPWFMRLFGIGDVDLSVAGGVVLGVIALRLIFPDGRKWVDGDEVDDDPLLVPLAVPLMAGPSALATVMLIAAQAGRGDDFWTFMFVVVGTCLLALSVLLLAVGMSHRIPRKLAVAIERLSGLLLMVIAVHMILQALIPLLQQIGTGAATPAG